MVLGNLTIHLFLNVLLKLLPFWRRKEAVDKSRNMEHPGTSNNYDNYEKKSVKLNFGLADVTIWSAQIGQRDIIGTLSTDNEMHDDEVRNPRRIGSRVSFLVGKRKVRQCVVLRRRPLLVLRLIALAMAFKNVRNLLLINPELTTTMALSMTMNLFFCTTSLYRKLRLSVRFVRAF